MIVLFGLEGVKLKAVVTGVPPFPKTVLAFPTLVVPIGAEQSALL